MYGRLFTPSSSPEVEVVKEGGSEGGQDVDAEMTQWCTSVTSSISLSQAVGRPLPAMLSICKQETERGREGNTRLPGAPSVQTVRPGQKPLPL